MSLVLPGVTVTQCAHLRICISPGEHFTFLLSSWKLVSYVRLFANPWTIQSMEFSRPEYWGGSLSLLQGIFPTQGLNPALPHYRQILYQLSHKGSPRMLEWVAYPFSSGSSWPRNWTGVSCTADGFFTNWAIREVLMFLYQYLKIKGTIRTIMGNTLTI